MYCLGVQGNLQQAEFVKHNIISVACCWEHRSGGSFSTIKTVQEKTVHLGSVVQHMIAPSHPSQQIAWVRQKESIFTGWLKAEKPHGFDPDAVGKGNVQVGSII